MRKIFQALLLAIIAGLALYDAIEAAGAADLPPKKMTLKAEPAPPSSWFYVGINGGAALTKSNVDFVTLPRQSGSLSPAGGLGGLTVGAGTFFGGLYFGLEADADYDFLHKNVPCIVVASCSIKSSWALSQRVKVGIAMSSLSGLPQPTQLPPPSQWPIPISLPAGLSVANIMPYVTAGIAETNTKACLTAVVGSECSQQWAVAPEFGGGLYLPVASGVSLDTSIVYDAYNKHFVPASPVMIFPANFHKFGEWKGKTALVYHF